MDSAELTKCMQRAYPQGGFLGVLAREDIKRLPARLPPRSCFILNTDPSWRAGQHWVGVYAPNDVARGRLIMFDSFAAPWHLIYSSEWNTYFTRQAHRLVQSPYPVQHVDSDACGHLTAYVLAHLPDYSDDLFKLVTDNLSPIRFSQNEALAKTFVARMLRGK